MNIGILGTGNVGRTLAMKLVEKGHQVMLGNLAGGDHDLFVCGNDPAAKADVAGYLRDWFGWKSVTDLGDITNARGTESYLLLWVRMYAQMKTAHFNLRIVK